MGHLENLECLKHCQGDTGNDEVWNWNELAVSNHELLPMSFSETYSEGHDEFQCKPGNDMVRSVLWKDCCGNCIVLPKMCWLLANVIRGHWLFLFFFSVTNFGLKGLYTNIIIEGAWISFLSSLVKKTFETYLACWYNV